MTEWIDFGNDPSLTWDMRRAAYRLTYLLGYTPQYAEVLRTVKEFANAVIEVTDEQQKCYADVERISRDIIRKVREKEKEEEKDLPVIGIRREEKRRRKNDQRFGNRTERRRKTQEDPQQEHHQRRTGRHVQET